MHFVMNKHRFTAERRPKVGQRTQRKNLLETLRTLRLCGEFLLSAQALSSVLTGARLDNLNGIVTDDALNLTN